MTPCKCSTVIVFALFVAVGRLPTALTLQCPTSSTVMATRMLRVSPTSLSAKPPIWGSRASTSTSSSPTATALEQSSVNTGNIVAGSATRTLKPPRNPFRGTRARLLQLKQHLTTRTSENVPSYSTMLKFCATTVLIWLSEPLLSLVDTTVVGWTQGSRSVVQLACLGPATTLMDSLLYSTYFLALSTTNLLTQGLAQKDWRGLQRWTSYLLTVAVVVGGAVTALIMSPAGPALLRALAGSAATPELLSYATKYTRIRAAVAPFSVLGMVAQSFCLANLRSGAPLLAVAAASLVNIIGDLALRSHGVVGAACATAVASLSSTAILLTAVRKQFKNWRKQEVDEWQLEQETIAILKELYAETDIAPSSFVMSGPTNGTEALFADEEEKQGITPTLAIQDSNRGTNCVPTLDVSDSFCSQSENSEVDERELTQEDVEGASTTFVDREVVPPKAVSFFSVPSRASLIKLATISGPLCINMWAKMASYAALTVRATGFGVVPLAAHNVLMRLFFFLGCFADAMGLSAQAFLPPNLYPFDRQSYHATLHRLRGVTALLAILLGRAAVGLVNTAGPYLARDGAMRAAMQSQASLLGWALFLHPLVVMMEGTVIATRDFGNLMFSYAAALAVHCFTLKTASSFGGVWKALVIFQTMRLVNLNAFRRKDPLRENATIATAAADGAVAEKCH